MPKIHAGQHVYAKTTRRAPLHVRGQRSRECRPHNACNLFKDRNEIRSSLWERYCEHFGGTKMFRSLTVFATPRACT